MFFFPFFLFFMLGIRVAVVFVFGGELGDLQSGFKDAFLLFCLMHGEKGNGFADDAFDGGRMLFGGFRQFWQHEFLVPEGLKINYLSASHYDKNII